MSIENIIQSWKSEEETEGAFPNPAGEELSDHELQQVAGGGGTITITITLCDPISCDPISCDIGLSHISV